MAWPEANAVSVAMVIQATTADGNSVLMRWKISDNQYRVIYGDLHTEDVTAEKLAELEKTVE